MRMRYTFFSLLLSSVIAASCIGQQLPIVLMQTADPQMGMFTHDHGSKQEIRNLTAVVREANLLQPSFLVICGDLVNKASDPEELNAFKTTIAQLKGVPLHLVAGNHDVGNRPTASQIALYRRRFGPDYYEFQSGPLIGVVLDSMLMADKNAPAETSHQYRWLQRTLKRAKRQKGKEIAIFQHIPFFVHSADEPDSYWNIPLVQRAIYLSLLHKYGVHYVFAGHLHRPVVAEGDDCI
ncbi:MAG: metallophosphoesterase [Terracidiphilus sp.]